MTLTLWENLPREQILVSRDALRREVAVPAVMPGVVTVSAAERLAARLYADLLALAERLDAVGLGYAVVGCPLDGSSPDGLEDDPQLALRLVTADVEQLWRDQLIAAAAVTLVANAAESDATTVLNGAVSTGSAAAARYLLIYRQRPPSVTPGAVDAMGSNTRPHARELAPIALWPPLPLPIRLAHVRLTLLLSWTPAAARRSWVFPRTVYTFQWEPVRAVTLDFDAAKDSEYDADEWTVCCLRRPSVLR